ncbi:hypothetical protein RK055_02085, partial [Streptococcus pneumoniae]|nr:hypothetical protein [Streptococcus pneumoniae]
CFFHIFTSVSMLCSCPKGFLMPFTIHADPHTQSFAMASVGILNGCFLYSFSCLQPHALGRQTSERGAF